MGGWHKGGGGKKGGGGGGGRNDQRYHKHRQDMVVPGSTGVIVSVDPACTGKAIRELKLLFEPLKPQAAIEAERRAAAEEAATAAASNTNNADLGAGAAPVPSEEKGSGGAFSLAAMLASELDSFRRPTRPDAVVANITGEGGEGTGGDAETNTNNNKHNNKNTDGLQRKKPAVVRNFRQEWFSTLETNCKGYVFVNIPKPLLANKLTNNNTNNNGEHVEAGGKTEEGEGDANKNEEDTEGNEEEENADGRGEPPAKQARTEGDAAAASASTPTSAISSGSIVASGGNAVASPSLQPTTTTSPTDPRFRANPYVTEVVEALMSDLSANPRPVTRFSYRLVPVEASCNPTLPCIVNCARELCDTLAVPKGRSLVRIGVSFTVKNNTTVQKERAYIKAAVEASLPKSKFVVFSYWNTNWQQQQQQQQAASEGGGGGSGGKFLIQVDAILHIFVAHSTCCMGLQRHLALEEGRRMYNLHDFGAGTMALGDITCTASAASASDGANGGNRVGGSSSASKTNNNDNNEEEDIANNEDEDEDDAAEESAAEEDEVDDNNADAKVDVAAGENATAPPS